MRCIVYIDRYMNQIYIQEEGKKSKYYMSKNDFDYNVKNGFLQVIQTIYV